MKTIPRLVVCIAAPGCLAALPLIAHADTDACTLLTPAQVGAAVGGPVSGGAHVTPTFVKTCTWTPSGKSQVVSVTLNVQTAAFFDGAKRQATMAAAATGKAEMKPASVGDDAYYFVTGDQVAVFVKKGAVSFKVAVYARIPAPEKEAMELKLAREVAAKFLPSSRERAAQRHRTLSRSMHQRQTQPPAALSQRHAEPQLHAAGTATYGVLRQPHVHEAPGQLAQRHWASELFMVIPFVGWLMENPVRFR